MTELTADENVWYLARDGKQHGPLTHLEMTKLVELGHLKQADLVWRPGFDNWRPAPSVFDLAPPAPPPPVVAPAAAARPAPAPQVKPDAAPASARDYAVAEAASAPARPQPSFAGLSAPVKPEPTRFELSPSEAGAGSENARFDTFAPATSVREPEPKPVNFDTRPFRPAGASQFGSPAATDEPVVAPTPLRIEPAVEERRPRKGRGVAVALGLLLAIGGLSAAGYTYRDIIKAKLQGGLGTEPGNLPVVEAPAPSNGSAPAAVNAAATETAPPPPAQPAPPAAVVAAAEPSPSGPAPLPGVPVTTDQAVDAAWQASPFWSLAKTEFPAWYADRVREAGELKAANQPEAVVDQKLVEAIVVLRRQNATKALAASSDRLKTIAEAFVANLNAMQSQSVDACYEFIGKGEVTPAAAALVQKPAEGAPLHAQLGAVFNAVVDGQKNPVTRTPPQTADYNLLAAELGTIGWSQADIQLFADPKALSAAPRDRVCKMVKDWFTAHLAVKDDAARERLLYETLRLVIAG